MNSDSNSSLSNEFQETESPVLHPDDITSTLQSYFEFLLKPKLFHHTLAYFEKISDHGSEMSEISKLCRALTMLMRSFDLSERFLSVLLQESMSATTQSSLLFRIDCFATRTLREFTSQTLSHSLIRLIKHTFADFGQTLLSPSEISSRAHLFLKRVIQIRYPREFCWVYCIISREIATRFPDSQRTVLSGIFFLRYLCPLLLNFSDLPASTDPTIYRANAVRLVKVLQNLANGNCQSLEIADDPHSAAKLQASIDAFFQQLCSGKDFLDYPIKTPFLLSDPISQSISEFFEVFTPILSQLSGSPNPLDSDPELSAAWLELTPRLTSLALTLSKMSAAQIHATMYPSLRPLRVLSPPPHSPSIQYKPSPVRSRDSHGIHATQSYEKISKSSKSGSQTSMRRTARKKKNPKAPRAAASLSTSPDKHQFPMFPSIKSMLKRRSSVAGDSEADNSPLSLSEILECRRINLSPSPDRPKTTQFDQTIARLWFLLREDQWESSKATEALSLFEVVTTSVQALIELTVQPERLEQLSTALVRFARIASEFVKELNANLLTSTTFSEIQRVLDDLYKLYHQTVTSTEVTASSSLSSEHAPKQQTQQLCVFKHVSVKNCPLLINTFRRAALRAREWSPEYVQRWLEMNDLQVLQDSLHGISGQELLSDQFTILPSVPLADQQHFLEVLAQLKRTAMNPFDSTAFLSPDQQILALQESVARLCAFHSLKSEHIFNS